MLEIEIYSVKNKQVCKIPVGDGASILDVKEAIEKQCKKLKVCRQSIRDDVKGKDLSNALLVSDVIKKDRLYVKDLGPQISWTAVFVAEYFGPLVVYSIFAIRPRLIYSISAEPMSFAAQVAWGCWSFHYAKRLLETIFVHRFSHGTMPLRNLFKNCTYYWGFAAYVAYHVNHPLYTPPNSLMVMVGTGLFALAEIGNFSVHILLRNLRPKGTNFRKIPKPDGNPFTILFNYVSCPNYTYEFLAWLGFSTLSSCIPALLFAGAGMYQMTLWALGKHKNYRHDFKDYPRNRKAIIPFVL